MNFDYSVTPIYGINSLKKIKVEEFKPAVSIITPFYNSGEYIIETAKSVLCQTFPWFEWLIIDDGSTDKKSLDILNDLSKKDKRIRVYHKKNQGLAATRDYGAKKSDVSAEYLLFLDDDDLIEKNYIECCYYSLETNLKATFAYTDSVGFGEQQYLWKRNFNINDEINENLLVATSLIRKKDFFSVGGYGLKEKGINEDWIFWLKLFTKSKIPLRLSYYGFWYRRKNDGELAKSKSNNVETLKYINYYKKNVDYSIKSIEYPKDDYNWDDVNTAENKFKIISEIKSNKTNIIMIMPHIVMGGADKFNIDFLKGLSSKYSVTAIFTNISNNEWLNEIKKYLDSYFILPSFLDRKYWHLFIDYLIKKNKTKIIFNTNSIYGYMLLPYIKCKNENIKIIDYIHMEEWYNRNGGYSRDSSSVASVIDKTLVCNKNSERILIDYFNRKKSDVETVYIGVDENKFKDTYTSEDKLIIKKEYGIPNNKKVISFIARIADQKRPFLLIEIIKKYIEDYKNAIFLVCGDGPLLPDLKDKISKYNLENDVLFLGSIKDTNKIYAISDCTLNCSIKEGLALTTYESLSMGVPVVSSNVGGQSEIIDDTVGFIINTTQKEEDVLDYNYSEDEINDFVNALHIVLSKNNYYKSNCRNKILSGFTIKDMNIKMNKILDNILKKKKMKIFNNLDISKELLNQYLLSSKEEYNYFVNLYNNSNQIINKINFIDRIKLKIENLKIKSIKLHIYFEFSIILKILKSIIYIFLIPIYLIELIVRIIFRFINIFKKVFIKIFNRR